MEVFNKQDCCQCQAGKAGGVLESLVDCSNDHESAEHENEQCLKYYLQRLGHSESLHKNGTKIDEWWSEGVLYAGVSGHYWPSSNWTRLAL